LAFPSAADLQFSPSLSAINRTYDTPSRLPFQGALEMTYGMPSFSVKLHTS